MKKASFWAKLVGILLLISGIFGIGNIVSKPTSIYSVNLAVIISSIITAGIGIFLFLLFMKNKQNENNKEDLQDHIADSEEDKNILFRKRNNILGFILLINLLGSSESFVLNDYSVGFTLLNIWVIFDILANILFLYIAVSLFKGKDVLKLFFYSIIIYLLAWTALDMYMKEWYQAILDVLLGGYFLYTIKAPLNRQNFRIANWFILGGIIIMLSASSFFSNTKIINMEKQSGFLENQFSDKSATLNNLYSGFLQKDSPNIVDIKDIKEAALDRDKKIDEMIQNVNNIQLEYSKKLPSVERKKILENNKYYLRLLDTHKIQSSKIIILMDYAEKLDFKNITQKQLEILSELKKDVDKVNENFTQINFEWSSANLNLAN